MTPSLHPDTATMPLVMGPHLEAVRARIDAAIESTRTQSEAMTRRLAPSDLLTASDLGRCIADLVEAGGKLVRPRLVLLGYLAGLDVNDPAHAHCLLCPSRRRSADVPTSAGASHTPRRFLDGGAARNIARLGAAFELLHVFGLLQDDVMDASATRRGRRSAHQRVADVAVNASPDTSEDDRAGSRRMGESIAILAGDLAFALAQREVRPLPHSVTRVWDEAVVELVVGQRLDLVLAAEGRFDEEATALVAQAKSGAYTVVRPLETGALLATPNHHSPAWLRRYGESVGAAFALADDVIGIWGDPEVTGKPAGDDLVERKPSSVVGIADTMLSGEITRQLGPGSASLDAPTTHRLLMTMTTAGVRDEALRRIGENLSCAIETTDDIACPALRAAFVETAHQLATRVA